jgi:hypothetical protein
MRFHGVTFSLEQGQRYHSHTDAGAGRTAIQVPVRVSSIMRPLLLQECKMSKGRMINGGRAKEGRTKDEKYY